MSRKMTKRSKDMLHEDTAALVPFEKRHYLSVCHPELPLLKCTIRFPLSSHFAPSMNTFLLLSLEDHRQAHEGQHDSLEPRVFSQQNSNITHKRNVAHHTTHDIFFAVQEILASSVEFGIVCCVVVAFCEELERRCFRSVFHTLALSSTSVILK
jgi:hypothetical protein